MLDKWIYVANRQLFFDINPYLNNLQVILRACHRYLKWVCLEKCAKPINGGPTLAGLMGGFAGDLQRLYPVQNAKMLPLKSVTSSQEYFVVRPLFAKERSQVNNFMQHMSNSVDHIVVSSASMTRTFATAIADQDDAKGYVIEEENGGVLAFIVATKQISQLLKGIKKTMDGDRVKQEKFETLNKNSMLAAFFCTRALFFSKALRSMFQAFFEAHVEDMHGFALIVDKYEDLVLSFLSDMNMRKTTEANSYVVIKKNTA